MAVRNGGPDDLSGPGALLGLVRRGEAGTRGELARLTGLSRATVNQRLEALVAAQYLRYSPARSSTGGRPALGLSFDGGSRVVLSVDLGATHGRLAVCDLRTTPLAEQAAELRVADGPERVLGRVVEILDELLAAAGRTRDDVRGIGVGVPGPVEFASGRPSSPPIMPGWDGFPVADVLSEQFGAPVLVDNDVNIMAVGEHWTHWRDLEHLLFVKVGTGIGCGVISGGRIHRGAQGAAGDIGHIRLAGYDDVACRCGNVGCLEAVAGSAATTLALAAQGVTAHNAREVVALVHASDTTAIRRVREVGRLLGEVLASLVNFFNPQAILVGGDLAGADRQLLAGIREVVYQRSLPLATRSLQLNRCRLGDRAGVVGAAVMIVEHVLAPGAVDRSLAGAAGF